MSRFGRPQLSSLHHASTWLDCAGARTDGPGPDLAGRVVVVDFCTFTCINWLRQLPYVRAWSRAYRPDGLVVVPVHTPEFSFEQDVERVRVAMGTFDVDDTVAIDNEYAVWTAFGNRYWPALYFFDADGVMRDFHYGEGRYEQSERVIQKLLGIDREPALVEAPGIQAPALWHALRARETYLGTDRSERFDRASGPTLGGRRVHAIPSSLGTDRWALEGEWTAEPERVVLERAPGRIAIRFHARDAHLVLSRRSARPVPFRIRIDGAPPGPSHGVDADPDGRGLLDASRLYHLLRQREPVGTTTLEIELLEPGVEAYAFSFG